MLSVDVKTEYEGDIFFPPSIRISTRSEEGQQIDLASTFAYRTNDWSRTAVTLPIAEEATFIRILVTVLSSEGLGTAWFDNLTLTATEWTTKDVILAAVSSRLAIWRGSCYDWLKVLMPLRRLRQQPTK